MQPLSILQIGRQDWTEALAQADLDWHFVPLDQLTVFLAQQEKLTALPYDYVLLSDEKLNSSTLARQISRWPAQRVLYVAGLDAYNEGLRQALVARQALFLGPVTPSELLGRLQRDFFPGQIAFPTRFSESQFVPMNRYDYHFQRLGRFQATFSGSFGPDFQQIGTLKTYPTDFEAGQSNEIYLDYETTGTVQVALSFIFYQNGRLQQMKTLTQPSVETLPIVTAPTQYQDYQILLLAKGAGQLTLRNLHQRKSRHGLGQIVLGGRRQLSTDGQELLSYFNPGTKRGPLVVLFGGTRLHVEGFDYLDLLDALGYPRLVLTDTRAQGGAFLVGSAPFEALVKQEIERAQRLAAVQSARTLFVGHDMGAYPALYYAGLLAGSQVIVAKPILNIGSFTANGDFAHQGVNHDWPLDVRAVWTGRLNAADTASLDAKLWTALDGLSHASAQVNLWTMTKDEYDGQAVPALSRYLTAHGVSLVQEEQYGQHEDHAAEMTDYLRRTIEQRAQEMKRGGQR
ncbi:accessory Sec system protein Asp2 [Leuconostocaceae bacterium ESL0958]|nr:accessory Sec system protein Asp2 [Leuconostocaceae bacterium ESL0958]